VKRIYHQLQNPNKETANNSKPVWFQTRLFHFIISNNHH